jgi:hypothetical protein
MEASAMDHRRMGGALVAKRWLDGRRDVDAAVQDDFRRSLEGLPQDAQAWAEELALIAAPPRGRVVDVVIARLARDLGTNEAEVRRLVFGAGRRASRLQ